MKWADRGQTEGRQRRAVGKGEGRGGGGGGGSTGDE